MTTDKSGTTSLGDWAKVRSIEVAAIVTECENGDTAHAARFGPCCDSNHIEAAIIEGMERFADAAKIDCDNMDIHPRRCGECWHCAGAQWLDALKKELRGNLP